ncbi:winged helix-turn-helix transcriptional regulator [Agromyces sp. MMS24-K17]|uniref:winged helix-turn-helix transcriptional regulator n=1 Tax=Agromyces sp. MMS24-K17 TaxID=3372850 RepID=UPI003754561C
MSRWGVLVMATLSDGTRRWGDLRRDLGGITEKMLASTLKTLVADGLVHREAQPTVPPHVEYSLTERGRELAELLVPLVAWVARNSGEMLDPQ